MKDCPIYQKSQTRCYPLTSKSSRERQSVCFLGSELRVETWPKLDTDLAALIGHLGDTTTKWDNGFLINCSILGISAAVLVDSGSTATNFNQSIPIYQ